MGSSSSSWYICLLKTLIFLLSIFINSRSPSRLVRQDCVKDDHHVHRRTFGEAKQQFQNVAEEDDCRPEYVDYFGDSSNSFLEVDETQYEKNYNSGFSSEPRIIYNDGSDDGSYTQYQQRAIVHSAENVLAADRTYGYYGAGETTLSATPGTLSASGGPLPRTPLVHNRLRRRQSRELQMQQDELMQVQAAATAAETSLASMVPSVGIIAADEPSHERRKPEQMRSISEDSGVKPNAPKPITRRSLSHPEKETQV